MKKSKIIFTIQARLDSKRLPGKTLEVVAGKPILGWLIDRIAESKKIDQIIVATAQDSSDDKIIEFCKKRNVPFFRGSKEDVLGRVFQAALFFKADATLRIGPDDPYIDRRLIDRFCDLWLKTKADYILNFLEPTYPWGINIDMFSIKLLAALNKEVTDSYDREHISPYMIRNQKKFRVVTLPKLKKNLTEYRLTIDYPEDLEVARKILSHFKTRDFNYLDIVKYLDDNANVRKLNYKYLPKLKVNAGD